MRSDLSQRLFGITKAAALHAHFMHHAEVQPAHLSVGFTAVVQILTTLDLPARTAQHDDWQLSCIVVAIEHARAEHQHGIVQQCAIAFLNCIHAAGQVRHLLEEKLIHFQPVVRVTV